MPLLFIALILILLIGIISVVFFMIFKNLQKKRLIQALNLKLLLIRLPLKSKDEREQADFKDEINLSAQLFAVLAGLKIPFGFETAVHHVGEEIYFYIAIPKESLEFASRQIEGLWKDAQVEPIEDYNIFNAAGAVSGAYIKQKISYTLPIRTYQEANVDTFSPLLSGLSKINEVGEGAAIQVLMKPAPNSYKNEIIKIIEQLKKGVKFEDLFKSFGITLKDIGKALNPKDKEKEEKMIDDEVIKSLESKISKPLFEVNLRVISSAPSQYQADTILESIAGGFSQFSSPRRQELKIIKPANLKKLTYQYSFREFDSGQSMILNAEELASMFHLPASTTVIPKIKFVKAKAAPPPAELPAKGTLIGESVFRGQAKPVYIAEEDRRRHIYIIGQTGTGKSSLMFNMISEDIAEGKGVGVVDPHGDLIEKILGQIPKERMDDVILFDPGDRWRPLGMNMLEYDFNRPEEKTFIVNELFSIFDKLYDMKATGGPMFEQYFKMTTLLLMEDAENEPATLMEVARVFTDNAFRMRKLARIANPVVIDFWEKEAAKATGEHSLANMSAYITSKINQFTANDFLRPIIGQENSAFNFRQVMDDGKILLLNLSKGKIGDINANLLGMVVVGKLLMAALSRADISDERKRRDFNLFIDEFQNFTTDSIAVILSEARKYRLNLTIVHQFIAQLEEKIRDAVFGNVGSMIAFRVGAPDADFLVKQFEPVFNQNDLINIDNLNAYAKILVNGQPAKPFNIKTPLYKKGNEEMAAKLKEISRLKYGRDRQEVEKQIINRLRA